MGTKRILVTNDDGIDASGITALLEMLGSMTDTEAYVFAPKDQQSAKSQSITFLHPVRIEKKKLSGAKAAFAVDGTPADCVKVALSILRDRDLTPDYIISGINMGHNLGMSAYYSGTISAAREGALNGIRSIALSVANHDASEFSSVLSCLPQILELADCMDPHTILSVNAPELKSDEIRGFRIVPAAPYGYGMDFIFSETKDTGEYQMHTIPAFTDDEMRYDCDWCGKGYVTISPISTSMDAPEELTRLLENTPFS